MRTSVTLTYGPVVYHLEDLVQIGGRFPLEIPTYLILPITIPSKLLCICSDILTPIITKFANVSLETNGVLNDWKLSRVTPIYKGKGDVNDNLNYRPISVISHIANIIEREVKHQMCTYLEHNALITVDQSAYRERHNTQTPPHMVLGDWYHNIADGLLTSVCSFDIKKCFDTINHSI